MDKAITEKTSKKVIEALEHTFNSNKISRLSSNQYKEYINAVAALTVGTMIKNEGRQFVIDFCNGALNQTHDMPIAQQVERH